MKPSVRPHPSFPPIAARLAGAVLVLASCGGEELSPGVPECRILARTLDFHDVVRPQGNLPNSVVDLPVTVRSVLAVRTEAGQEDLAGRVSFRVTSDLPVPPLFRVPEADGNPEFILEPEEDKDFTLEATVTGETTPGLHTGYLDFGEACGGVPFRINVVGWDENPPAFVSMWGRRGDEAGEFDAPTAAAVDSRGRIYVVDRGNNRVQVFEPDGTFVAWWLWLAENQLLFNRLTGIAIDENDIVYVADEGSPTPRISLFHTDGTRIEVWDRVNRSDLARSAGRLAVRDRVAFLVDPEEGNVLAVTGDYETIGVQILNRIGKRGEGESEFGEPRGVAVDGEGRVYITDVEKHAVFVFTEEGEFLYRFGREGSLPGFFHKPAGILFGPGGFLYIVDEENVRVQKFTTDGRFLSLWGHPGYLEGAFFHPLDVASGPDGSFYVVEEGHHRVQRFQYQDSQDSKAP